ncbi:PREDICTED: LOW QUALITY PROTEIN: prostaglandin G/H synthase 1-like, partial [Pterocles gutturalis]|uniref:LOW QUALITY PROTEIN: prostaglandin G/H synthase 1-like n=1 Tax=Pterocles gutturalis TaxID=240206 RepID=UPI00052951BF
WPVTCLSVPTVNPCCSYPCQHQGVCVRVGVGGYECDCTRTGYFGDNCTSPELWTRLRQLLKPSPAFYHFILTHFRLFWDIVNSTFIRDTLMRLVLTAQALLFCGESQPVDLGHLYGDNLQRQHQLRLFRDGKLKFQVVDGEVYPPTVTDAPVHMVYPPGVPKEKQLAMGQEVFGLLPGLCLYATLWLREHNRVCDVLKREHPTWSDEQLFQTARLILIGETIKIVIEDYVQHLSGYFLSLKFDPELLFGTQFQYRNRIAVEFNQLYHWHGLMPDSFVIQGEEYSYEQFLYNTSMLMDYGVEALVESFSKQIAGRGRSCPPLLPVRSVPPLLPVLGLQNTGRDAGSAGRDAGGAGRDDGGEEEKAAELEELYGDIDALEFYLGLLLEKPQPNGIFGESMVEIGAPFSLKAAPGLLGNPICSPEYWKPSTFGGATGFEIVKTASLEKLVCLNVKKCPYVAFRVPDTSAHGVPRHASPLLPCFSTARRCQPSPA